MKFDVLLAGVPVRDFTTARAWYERFFGRPPDVVAHAAEVLWQVSSGGWLYIVEDRERAGKSSIAIAVPVIDDAVSVLEARSLAIGPIEPQGATAKKAVAQDPDGNVIALIQVDADR